MAASNASGLLAERSQVGRAAATIRASDSAAGGRSAATGINKLFRRPPPPLPDRGLAGRARKKNAVTASSESRECLGLRRSTQQKTRVETDRAHDADSKQSVGVGLDGTQSPRSQNSEKTSLVLQESVSEAICRGRGGQEGTPCTP